MTNADFDPKKLFVESFRMDGITIEQCRSIFLDWALSLPDGLDTKEALETLLADYQPQFPDHPMTQVMVAGLEGAAQPRRRGGWRSRPR